MYKQILSTSEYNEYKVLTVDVDLNKHPDYFNIDTCIEEESHFDLSIICCPNFLHEFYVEKLATVSTIVLVEKPGLKDKETWEKYYSKTKNIFMVKNNMWREELTDIKKFIQKNKRDTINVELKWLNKNRIPSPGTWFTNKELAFGGVSRDLLPHLLSVFYSLYGFVDVEDCYVEQKYNLSTIETTDYGVINKDGVYDVDDFCSLKMYNGVYISCTWKLPNWIQSKLSKDIIAGIKVVLNYKTPEIDEHFFEFGLCPESCYDTMINYFINITEEQKKEHYLIDCWIHEIIENIN